MQLDVPFVIDAHKLRRFGLVVVKVIGDVNDRSRSAVHRKQKVAGRIIKNHRDLSLYLRYLSQGFRIPLISLVELFLVVFLDVRKTMKALCFACGGYENLFQRPEQTSV